MNYYCSNCFSKSEYKFSKPKFCAECGAKTSSEALGNKNPSANLPKDNKVAQDNRQLAQRTSRIIKNDESEALEDEMGNEENYEQDYYCSDLHSIISKIKPGKGVSVEGYKENKGVSFASLMEESSSSASSSNDFKFQNDGVQKTKQQILEELKAEASSTRKHIEIE